MKDTQMLVVANHFVVGVARSCFREDEPHLKLESNDVIGVFNNVEDAKTCLFDHLPSGIWDWIDSQYYIPKELFAQVAAIYPEMETMVEKYDMGTSWEILTSRDQDMPELTTDQRTRLAAILGVTFEYSCSIDKYYINRTAFVPVEVII
jgi:hypothetical protein